MIKELSPRHEMLNNLISNCSLAIKSAKTNASTASLGTNLMVGHESRGPGFANEWREANTNVTTNILHEGKAIKSKAARTAAAILMGASANAEGYITQIAQENFTGESAKWHEPGYSSRFGADYGKAPMVGQEYFSKQDLDNNLGLSVAMNVRSLETQSRFSERLFPTIVVDASDSGITIRTKLLTAFKGAIHALRDKDTVEAKRRNLLDGLTDPTLLDDDAIKVVPYKLENGENEQHFVDDALIQPEVREIGKVKYPTQFLKFGGGRRSLLGLSAHPGIAAEGFTETDEIAPGAAVDEILVSIYKKGETADKGSLIKLNVLNMAHATFQRPAEGDGRDLILNFRNNKFALNGDTLDHAGHPIPALEGIKQGKYKVNFELRFTHDLNTQGFEVSGPCQLHEVSLFAANGTPVDTASGAGKTVVDGFVIEALGYSYDMTRTNENRRTQSILLDAIWKQENFKLRHGSPVTSKSPINETVEDAERLDDLTTAVNIRNESMAISQTLGYSDQIKEVAKTIVDEYEVPSMQGLGRYWVRPFYDEQTVILPKSASSLDSKELIENARSVTMNVITEQVTRGLQIARYLPALQQYTGNPDARPHVTIACDEYVRGLLIRPAAGEARLINDFVSYDVVSTADIRWRSFDAKYNDFVRRIQWFLTDPTDSEGQINVLTWGNHFWTALLVTNTNIQRQGGVSKELTVQPRNIHVCHCPVTGVVNVVGMTELLNSPAKMHVVTAQAAPVEKAKLDGLAPKA